MIQSYSASNFLQLRLILLSSLKGPKIGDESSNLKHFTERGIALIINTNQHG